MTVAAKPSVAEYLEDGSSLSFPAPFRFRSANDLVVERIVDGVVLPLAIGTDYSVTGGQTDAGGTVTRTAATTGARLRIRRRTVRAQPMVYTTGDRFPAGSHEEALDRGMLIAQEQAADLDDIDRRALMVPAGEASLDLPLAPARAGSALVFDAAGQPVAKPIGSFPPGPPGGNILSIRSKIEAASVAIGAGTNLVQTADYGGNGVGQSLYTSARPDAATILAQHPRAAFKAADGRVFAMVKQAPPITAFGTNDELTTSASDAIDAAALWAWQRGEPKIIIPRGNFRCTRPLAFDFPLTVEGCGGGRDGSNQSKAILTFGETDGVVFHSDRSTPNVGRPGAFGSILRGVKIVGGQTSRTTAAIRMRATAKVEDFVTNFFGLGCVIEAKVSSGDQFEGNANHFIVRDGRFDSARVGGLNNGGSDANGGSFMNLDASNCGLYGFRFATLLSNTILALHTAANGTYDGARDGWFGGVNHQTAGVFSFYTANQVATQDELANTVPGTNGNVWIRVFGGTNPTYPIWQAGYSKYAASGGYLYAAVNSPTPLIGLYSESDELPSQFLSPAFVVGGSLDAGFVGNAVVLTSRSGVLQNRRGFQAVEDATGIGGYYGGPPGTGQHLNWVDPTNFPSGLMTRQRASQMVDGFGSGDGDIFRYVDGEKMPRPGRVTHRYRSAALLPGPFADNAAAAAGGVPVGEEYRRSDGSMAWRT